MISLIPNDTVRPQIEPCDFASCLCGLTDPIMHVTPHDLD